MIPRRILVQIDACRPQGDDLALPELAELRALLTSDQNSGQASEQISNQNSEPTSGLTADAARSHDNSPGDHFPGDPPAAEFAAESSAEVARVFAAMKEQDQQWSRALHSVPAPADLSARLLAALAVSQQVAPLVGTQSLAAELPPNVGSCATVHLQGRSRRSWLAVAGSLAAAVALGGVALLLHRPAADLPPSEALILAERLYERDDREAGGASLFESAPPAPFALSPLVDGRLPWRWRTVANFLQSGRGGAAFDLTLPGGGRATLYVTASASRGAVPHDDWASYPVPPRRSSAGASGSLRIAAWREPARESGGPALLFVLVVDGGSRGGEYAEELYSQLVRDEVA